MFSKCLYKKSLCCIWFQICIINLLFDSHLILLRSVYGFYLSSVLQHLVSMILWIKSAYSVLSSRIALGRWISSSIFCWSVGRSVSQICVPDCRHDLTPHSTAGSSVLSYFSWAAVCTRSGFLFRVSAWIISVCAVVRRCYLMVDPQLLFILDPATTAWVTSLKPSIFIHGFFFFSKDDLIDYIVLVNVFSTSLPRS